MPMLSLSNNWPLFLGVMLAKIVAVFVVVLLIVAYATWLERKVIGHMQVRLGPMETGWHGLLQPIADGLKLFFKEDIIPSQASKVSFILAPMMILVPAFITVAVIPFGPDVTIGGYTVPLQITDLNVGILYILAMAGLGVYGIVLAGWSSNSKYSLLGGIRSSAQMISYELSAALAIVSVFMLSQTLSLRGIVAAQSSCVSASSASSPTGTSFPSRWPSLSSWSAGWPKSTAPRSTCRRPNRSWFPASAPNTRQ